MRKLITITFILVVALIKLQGQPAAPTVGTITQPTCSVATGSVVLNDLPATGQWTLTRTPDGFTTYTGTGTTTTIIDLPENATYTFTVTDDQGETSVSSGNVIIYAQPLTPISPTIGTITQPACGTATGSVVLGSLPATGTWILTRTPDGTTYSSTGTSYTVSGLPAGTSYTFTVTNADECISEASNAVAIDAQPTQTPPTVGTITQPTCSVATGSVVLGGLPSTGTWTLTRTPGGTTYSGTGTSYTVSGLTANTSYTFTVTNADGCISAASNAVAIGYQPSTPTAPNVGTITQPT